MSDWFLSTWLSQRRVMNGVATTWKYTEMGMLMKYLGIYKQTLSSRVWQITDQRQNSVNTFCCFAKLYWNRMTHIFLCIFSGYFHSSCKIWVVTKQRTWYKKTKIFIWFYRKCLQNSALEKNIGWGKKKKRLKGKLSQSVPETSEYQSLMR